ncbi:MAG: WS/DGAT domain-containing protein, partial [Betaproteobacteria bacterium]
SPHWYDNITLVMNRYIPFLALSDDQSAVYPYFAPWAHRHALERLTQPASAGPFFLGEVGIPWLGSVAHTAKALEATIHDHAMAICATALRNWLARHDGVPRQPLVAAVPFSLRPAGDTAQNNQVSMMLTELATQEADPLKRLAAIRASMARGKRVIGGATSGLKALIPTDLPSLGTPWLISSLAALYARTHLADRMRPVANVVISNVMGAPVPLYMAGAKMTHYWPLSIVVHSVALNITVQSYDGRLEFGLVACRDALPRVDELAVLLQAAADEYEALASAHAARVLPATSPTTSPAAAATAAPARPPRKTPTRRRPSRQPS